MADVPRVLARVLKQKAVYWPPAGTDDFGRTIHGDPLEIKCRWEDTTEAFLDKDGNERMSRARVYVDRDLDPLGALKLAEFSQLDSLTPIENEDVYEIRRFDRIPNRQGKKFVRIVFL